MMMQPQARTSAGVRRDCRFMREVYRLARHAGPAQLP
jgi:hypothetical protein